MRCSNGISRWLLSSGMFALLYSLMGRSSGQTCVQPPPGLVAWWPGDGNANDIVGSHNGTLQNGATFAPGLVGQAFSFDGVDDFIQVLDSDLWAFGTKDFTIDMWVNFASIKPDTIIGEPQAVFIGNDEGSGDQTKWAFLFGGGQLAWSINSPALGAKFIALTLARARFRK